MDPPPPPIYPVSDEPSDAKQAAAAARWGVRIGVVAVVILVAVVLFLHLSGVVGPGAH